MSAATRIAAKGMAMPRPILESVDRPGGELAEVEELEGLEVGEDRRLEVLGVVVEGAAVEDISAITPLSLDPHWIWITSA